jgi:1,4-dihydroxy-2-naphthoyl-CoA hydrolase
MNLKEKISWIKKADKNTFDKVLGVKYKKLSLKKVEATIRVTKSLKQPFGLLHGGVHLAFAESLASIGGWLNAPPGKNIVGIELNGNHLRAITSGTIRGVAAPVYIGRRTQVWEIKIYQNKDLAHVARCTLMAVNAHNK